MYQGHKVSKSSCARPSSQPDIIISLCVTHRDLILMAYNAVSLFFLYVRATWSLRLSKGHRPRVFGNRVPKIIFGPKRFRKLEQMTHQGAEILASFIKYYSGGQIKDDMAGGTSGTHE